MWRELSKDGEAGRTGSAEQSLRVAREAMVEEQIRQRGISDERVLEAMGTVPRHEFVSAEWREKAYEDAPLPIGEGQTISQPYMVGSMTSALRLCGTERVLEIGTGCGYQAAVLGCIAREVHSVEVRPELAKSAAERVRRLGYANVEVHCGDGSEGLAEFAPYDAILVAAAAPELPKQLIAQLSDGGRMIVPVGKDERAVLIYVKKRGKEFDVEQREACRFVPLVGHYGRRDS
jgi:protein-L-isoaspartate(D-aspartate) O-methyltransferase